MSTINNFSLGGVGSNVRFGKGNGRIRFSAGTGFEVRNALDSALDVLHIATPTLTTHAATKGYVDGAFVNGSGLSLSAGTFSIGSNAVTHAMIAKSAPTTLLGNSTAGTADVQDISLGSTLTFGTASTLNIVALTGDVTTDGTNGATLGTSGVTAGTYGAGTSFPQIIVDAKGRITSATTVALGSISAQNSNSVSITGGTINGATIVGVTMPTGTSINSLDAANRAYVDAAVQGINVHSSVEAATTVGQNIGTYTAGTTGADGGTGVGATLQGTAVGSINAGTGVIDGYTGFTVGNRVLVKNQTTGLENGIYSVTNLGGTASVWVLTRAADGDNHAVATDVDNGDFVFVADGSTNKATGWIITTENPIVVGTTSLIWTQFSGAQNISVGTGLSMAGNIISVGTNGISNALFRQSAANTLVGNSTGTTGNVADIALGATLAMVSGSLQTTAFSGDVSSSANSGVLTLGSVNSNVGDFAVVTVGTKGLVTAGKALVASGDVSGTSSGTALAITLGTSGVTAGTYGSSTSPSIITVDAKGRVTAASTGTVTLGTGSVTSVAVSGTDGISVSGSPITSSGTIALSLGTITPSAVSAVGAVTGSNLSGTNTGDQTITLGNVGTNVSDVTTSGMTNGTFVATLATLGTFAGTYGGTTNIPVITVNNKGLITAVSNQSITYGTGSVTSIASGNGLTGGPVTSTGTLSIQLDGTAGLSGLTVGTAGLKLLLDTNPGLVIGTAGLRLNIASLALGATVAGTDLMAISQSGTTVYKTVSDVVTAVSPVSPSALRATVNTSGTSQAIGTLPTHAGIATVVARVIVTVATPFTGVTTMTIMSAGTKTLMSNAEVDFSVAGTYVAELDMTGTNTGEAVTAEFDATPGAGSATAVVKYDLI